MTAFPIAIPRTAADNKKNGGEFYGDANFEDFLGATQTFKVSGATANSVLTLGQHNLGTGTLNSSGYKWTVPQSAITAIYDEYKTYNGSEYIEANCTNTNEDARLYRGTDNYWFPVPEV